MDKEKIKQVVTDGLDHIFQEMKKLSMKQQWSAGEHEMFGKMLENMEKAVCIMQMTEGEEGYSGRRGYSRGYAGDGYASRSGDGYASRGRSYADGRSYAEGGYSERSRGANGQYRSGDEYSGHSIEDRMIDQMESMAGRAGNDYERQRIQEGIEALRRVFN